MNFNFSELPPQKKKVLAIGGIAFIVLLFVSFLLSLSEDDTSSNNNQQEQVQTTVPEALTTNNQQIPTSQRFDFDNGNDITSGGLESLLTDNSSTSEIGVDNNPFANMQGNGTTGTLDIGQIGTGTAPSYGPAPIPQEEELVASQKEPEPEAKPAPSGATLYCDKFKSANEAESQKAMLAFQGISATVVEKDGVYRLKIGPFSTKDLARAKFNELGGKGLVDTCSLVQP